MGFGYEGKKVRLVPMDMDLHFENAYRWINDPEISAWLAVGHFPISRLAEKEWFEATQKLDPSRANFAIETLDGEHIGFSGLFRIDFQSSTAHSGSIIGNRNHWEKGLGSDAARLRAWYGFEILGLRTLYSDYLEGNVRSERMQAAAGYQIWGRQPDAVFKNGGHRALIHTVLTKARWEQLLVEGKTYRPGA